MTRTSDPRPLMIRSVNLWWYPLALVPIVALVYFSFTGALPSLVAPVAFFLLIFWLSSFGFAVWSKLSKKKPRELRQ